MLGRAQVTFGREVIQGANRRPRHARLRFLLRYRGKLGSGMSVSILRNLICWALSVALPLSLLAADTGSAVLHSKGGVWVNGSEAPDSTAVVPGDLLETKPGSVADLDADGSSMLIQPQSVVKFNGDSLTLEHGGVSVATSKAMSVDIDCIRVVPVSNEWTQYDVTDLNGTVQAAARKKDVNIKVTASVRKSSPESAASQSATVREGEQATRVETEVCGTAKPKRATDSNKKWIEIGAGVGGGVILLCLLLCHGKNPPHVSPWQP
jgi:hypothetical protein